jgi:hypothetical protein
MAAILKVYYEDLGEAIQMKNSTDNLIKSDLLAYTKSQLTETITCLSAMMRDHMEDLLQLDTISKDDIELLKDFISDTEIETRTLLLLINDMIKLVDISSDKKK